jgi:arginyl-tRNA synthetase
MLPGQEGILAALAEALSARGYGDVKPALTAIEPPRDWGVTTNVCFMLAGRAAQAEIEQRTASLEKKAAKALAAEITREAGPKLARELAEELSSRAGALAGKGPKAERDLSNSDHSKTNGQDAKAGNGNLTGEAPALPLVSKVKAEGAYINFYYDPVALSQQIVSEVVRGGYGKGAPTGKRIMVEYAQPNTHKDFHVGHLRNASIGQAIANVLEFEGNFVLHATYLGDIGAHVSKAMWAHENSHDDGPPRGDALAYWQERYKAGNEAAKNSPQALEEQRAWLRNWETHDPVARGIWEASRESCVKSFKAIFSELEITFDPDCWFFESTVDDTHLGQKTAQELKNRGVAVVDESEEYKGALYVDFAAHAEDFPEQERKRIKQLGKMTILRSDGTSLYQTKELGLAKYKFDNFAIDESLYVVGSEQKLYFEQVFAILRLWGFPNAENCRHIAYELVVLPEGKMSSREGTVVSYRELRDEAIRRATEVTREKGIVGDVEQTAKDIAIAAIKYAMLQVSGNQQIVFDFEQALSFDGRAAPYLQYAYARAGKLVAEAVPTTVGASPAQPSSMPEQAETPITSEEGRTVGTPAALHPSEIALTRTLSHWPTAARTAAAKYEPAVIANYLYELADAFNGFYRDCRVLDAPVAIKPWRQDLTRAFRAVMKTGFDILALPLPEAM